jgi:LmbE family N-acetylglucosaminyl deacetylase
MKVLILCAHPDDIEFSIPNLVIGLSNNTLLTEIERNQMKSFITHQKDKKLEIKVAAMTRGEMSSFTYSVKSTKKAAEIRTKELEKSQSILSNRKPMFLGFFDGYVKISDEAINKVKKLIEEEKPDILIAPEAYMGWYHHPDHTNTGKITFFALKRIASEKKKTPRLFYFQAILNDFYYPAFPFTRMMIQKALDAHESQKGLLFVAKIPKFFESVIHGLRMPNFLFAESLRYQPIVPIAKYRNRFHRMNLFKRIIYYITKHAIDAHPTNYSKLYNAHYDG